MRICRFILFTISWLSCYSLPLPQQQTQSDNGDGTYTNPVIYSDFPDPDVIRVDSVTTWLQQPCLFFRE